MCGRYRGRMRHGLPDNLSDMVAATLKQGFPLLRFPAPLEARYQNAMSARRLRVQAIGVAFSLPLYLLLFVADHEMVPDSMAQAFLLRLEVFPIVVALCGLTLIGIKNPARREWVFAAFGLASCLISALVSLSSHSAMNTHHLATLNPIVIYAVLLGRFWPMLVMCSGVSVVYFTSVFLMGRLFSDIGVGVGLLLQANITFMLYGCYLLERVSRQSFLIDQQEAEMDAELHETTDQLARIAQEDALTGLANRRCFTDHLRRTHERACREGEVLALLMIDVDHFKAYNDRYGHPAGDECLRRVAQALAAGMRQADSLVARWGGEEFAIILPGADGAQALAVADHLLATVRACAIAHEASQVASVVTLSIGVAVWSPGHEASQARLLAVADDALYHSKTTGRNRVTLNELPLAAAPSACEPQPAPRNMVSAT